MVHLRWTRCAAALAVAACVIQGAAFAEDAPAASCSLTVSAEDAARGLDVVTDAKCASGGDGCIDTICRHCRVSDSTEADVAAFPSCLDYVPTGSGGPSDLSGSGDNDDGSGSDDDGSGGSGDSGSGDDGGSGWLGDMPSHLTADATVSGASYGCPFPTSGGDFAAGIQLVGDASCARGGLGCFADVCRFCKFQQSPKSAHLLTCESLGYKVRRPLVVPVLPPVNPDTGCPYNVSSGDFAVGVQLVGDPSCGGGGLGCFKDVCRFCKFQETPQSKHWRSCADFGYPHTPPPPAPTFATVSLDDDGDWTGETACAYAVSPGDFAVGVQLVGDASCATGGLGCFGQTCRFCQFRTTPQSKHMLTCASLGYPRPAQPVAAPQDIGIADPVTNCPFPVSGGDFAAGVQLVGDPSCAKGGLGCFKDVCRFCKFRETAQSKHWLPCSDYNYPPVAPPIVQPADINEPAVDYGTGCPFPVSSGDYAAGVQLVGDASCAKGGGLGCFKDVCRFCKFQETAQSKNWVPCAMLGWPSTVAPIARPVEIVTEDPATECPYPVSKGDFAAGIQLVGDASCVKGGLGCYKNVCRFCKFQDSPQSGHFVPCSDLGYPRNGATFAPVSIDANDETGCPYPVSSGDYDAGVQLVGDASCAKGGTGCFKDTCRFCKFRETPQSSAYLTCEDLGYFFGSTSGALVPAPTAEGPSSKCPFTASPGDLAAGVLLVGDVTCDKGGIGCYEKVCRFCQFVPTEKSNQFVTCASLGYDYALPPLPTVPAPTPAPVPTTTAAPPPPATTTAPTPTTAPTLPPCPFAVSPGDFAAGINLVGDPTCAAGGVGCFQDVCRYCKFKDTPQAANWVPCSNYIQPVAAPVEIVETAPPTTLPPPPTLPPVTPPPIVAQVCDRPVSQGDRDAGVGLATDYSCLIRGLGCVQGSVCRFCRVFQSEKSNHLEACSVYGAAAPAPAIEAPAPAAADPNACVARLAVGETQGGVSAYYDASCSPAGGVGCFGGVCRYCQVFASDKSKDFVPCPVPAAPSVAGPVAPNVAPPVAVAFQEYATGFAAAEKSLDKLLEDKTFRTTMLAAACVGAVAVVALVALGTKRAVTRRASAAPVEPSEQQEDARQLTPQPTPSGVLEDEV